MPQDDLELLRKFTRAIESASSEGNMHVHVMPDRIIDAIRRRIVDLRREYDTHTCTVHCPDCPRIRRLIDEYDGAIKRILAAITPK